MTARKYSSWEFLSKDLVLSMFKDQLKSIIAITRGKKAIGTWVSKSSIALKRGSEFMWCMFLGQQKDSGLLRTLVYLEMAFQCRFWDLGLS